MGEVISFQRQSFRGDARRRLFSSPAEGEAQILFFTGVRYYRDDDDGQKNPKMETRKTRRATASRSRRKKRA